MYWKTTDDGRKLMGSTGLNTIINDRLINKGVRIFFFVHRTFSYNRSDRGIVFETKNQYYCRTTRIAAGSMNLSHICVVFFTHSAFEIRSCVQYEFTATITFFFGSRIPPRIQCRKFSHTTT